MPRVLLTIVVLGVLTTAMNAIHADTLRVGQPLPALKLLYVADGEADRLASLQDVVTHKTMVFVFASW